MSFRGSNINANTPQIWNGTTWVPVESLRITEPSGNPRIDAAPGTQLTISPILLEDQATPPTTPADGLVVYSMSRADVSFPAWKGKHGLVSMAQEFLGGASVGIWKPPGNATTVPGVFGRAALTAAGTVTARNIATTNILTRMRRLGYVLPAAAANTSIGARTAVAQITTGTGADLGGFYKCMRFANSDPAIVADAKSFFGVLGSTALIAGAQDPSLLTNCFGVGRRSGDVNMHLFWGGSVAQTPVNLGAAFPSNTLNTPYELHLFCPPSGTSTMFYELINLATGATTGTQSVSGASGTAIPSSATLLSESHFWRASGPVASVVAIDVLSDYTAANN